MYYIRKTILSSSNYQLDRCFSEISGASYGDKFANLAGLDDFTQLSPGSFGGSSTFGPDIWSSGKVIHVRSNLTCLVASLGSLVMINCMSATLTLDSASVVTYLKVSGRGITM